jgi:Mrp family chromosome partitioning ATPase
MINRSGSPIAERYRRLRLKLDQPGPDGAARQVIVVTSAVPEEGKTTTAINLALALAEDRDRRTLDRRRPSPAFGDPLHQPATHARPLEVLTGEAPLDHVIIEVKSARLSILPARPR